MSLSYHINVRATPRQCSANVFDHMLVLLDPNPGEQAAEDAASALAEEAAHALTAEQASDLQDDEDRAEDRAAAEAEAASDAAAAEEIRLFGLGSMDANICEADCLHALSD